MVNWHCWGGVTDQLPRIRSGELKELDRIVQDGEEDDDDHIAKTITNTALKYGIYAGFILRKIQMMDVYLFSNISLL